MLEYQARLGDYTLGRKLGSGQYSKVRECVRDGHKFAAKYIPKGSDRFANDVYLELISNEANAMSQLGHPNVLRLYELGNKGVIEKPGGKKRSVLYIIMELATGGALFDYVAVSGRFSDNLARHFFHQLISALEFMHSKGLVHRDIKAENVLLDSCFALKLADFGFAAPAGGRDGCGKLSTYKGTPGYMAPEIHMGKSYDGAKVDIFSAGVLLFIMVAEHPPFRKAVPTDGFYRMFCQNNELFWSKVEANKPAGTFSPAIKDLLNRMLSASPDLRPTVAEIKAHLWYKGPTLTEKEVAEEFARRKSRVETDWRANAEKLLEGRKAGKQKKAVVPGFCPHAIKGTRGSIPEAVAKEEAKRVLIEYKV